MSQSDPPFPSFTIGVTGNMDLDFSEVSREELEARLRTVYLFLRYGWECQEGGAPPVATRAGEAFAELLAYPRIEKDLKPLKEWPGIGPNAEMVLLSSMAPGADTIAARVLLDLSKDERYPNFRAKVRVVLPFPEDLYLAKATTFANPDRIENIKTYRCFDAQIATEDRFIAFLDEDLCENPCRLAESTEAAANGEAESSLRQQFVADLEDKANRNRRYQAAGEYVAGFCDLLIAIYDDRSNSGARAGANQIVKAKRWGLTPGLLPHSHPNTWADNGPVMHLYHPREKTRADTKDVPDPSARLQTPIRLLQPIDLGPKDDETRDRLEEVWTVEELHSGDAHEYAHLKHAFAEWHSQGNQIAVRIGRNFREFNESPVDEPVEASEMVKLSDRAPGDDAISDHLRTLDSIARVRCRAKNLNYPLNDNFKGTLKRLFLCAFFAAVLLHLFSHWHPQFHKAKIDHANVKAHGAEANLTAAIDDTHQTAQAVSGHEIIEKRYKWFRFGFGTGSMILAFLGLFGFLRFLVSRIEERRHDYRALSEALRIQFYWGMAGLRRSVASNYMQRIRSEMDWIRNSVSSLTFPSERFQRSFLRLSRIDQIELLKMTIHQWVRPPIRTGKDTKRVSSRQEDYFLTTYELESGRLHLFHQTGSCIALAGLLQAVWLVCLIKRNGLTELLLHDNGYADWPQNRIVFGFALLFLSFLCGIYHRMVHDHGHPNSHGFWRSLSGPWVNPKSWLRISFSGILTDLFFHRHSAREKFNWRSRIMLSLANFGFALIPAIGIMLVFHGLIVALARSTTELPGPLDLGIVAMGACLVGGALLIAYAERQLLSEHAYQYKASYTFFASARLRLEDALDGLETARQWAEEPEKHINKSNALWKEREAVRLTAARKSRVDARKLPDPRSVFEISQARALLIAFGETEFIQHRERIHQLLYALGKEALDENSEWLILHRSRPMEPVMAG